MDRNELIVRLAVADWGNPRNAAPVPHVWIGEIARYADAVMSVLTPATVAPPAGKYEPRVGDVVIGLFTDNGLARVDSTEPLRWSSWFNGKWHSDCEFDLVSGVRLATPSELAAAGLAVPPPAPTPAPEAKRPTHVRITGPSDAWNVTIGKVYPVTAWDKDGCPAIENDTGSMWWLPDPDDDDFAASWPSWEPCDPPAVAAPADRAMTEALEGLITAASWVMDLLKTHGPSIVPHLLDTDDNAGERLRSALTAARALVKPAKAWE